MLDYPHLLVVLQPELKGLLGADRLIACPPGELPLKFGNVLWAFRPVGE